MYRMKKEMKMKIEFELSEEIIAKVCEEMYFDIEAGKVEIKEFFENLDIEENYILADEMFAKLLRGALNV